MLLEVVYLGFGLASLLVVDVYAACLQPTLCPCGTSGKSYMRCLDTFEEHSCESWVNCQTCKDYNEFCVTCPPGRSGLLCEIESTLTSEPSCIPPERIKNGYIQNHAPEMQRFPLNSVLDFKCLGGYELVGAPAIQCLRPAEQLGYWSDFPPICRSIPKLTRKKRGTNRRRWDVFPDTGKECTIQITGHSTFSCATGMDGKVSCDVSCNYKLQGRYHCFPGRGWDSTIPNCKDLKEPMNDSIKEEKLTCPDPGTPNNGGRKDLDGNHIPSQHTFKEGDSLVFFCNDGKATLQGHPLLTCNPDGTWNGILPLCVLPQKEVEVKQLTSCKDPEVFENGIVEDFQPETEQFPVGAKLRFQCIEGYVREGPEFIHCLSNLSWSEAAPICKLISTTTVSTTTSELFCEHPRTIENGIIKNAVPENPMQRYPLNSVLVFVCKEGYELIGTPAIQCLSNAEQLGYWTPPLPVCKSITTETTSQSTNGISCQNPGMVENGMFENYPPETVSFSIGTTLKFQCLEGYIMEGSSYIYCILPGKWSESLPNCRIIPTAPVSEVFCGHPGMVSNGTFEGMSQSRFPVGITLTFRCSPGTRIEGEKHIHCLNTGKWSTAPPICRPTRKEPERGSTMLNCKHPGIITNGITEPSVFKSEIFTTGQKIEFKCNEGYTIEGPDTIYCESSGKWTLTPPVCRRLRNIAHCGRVFQELYKTSGTHTLGDWPWTVGLSTGNEEDVEKVFCGGALLNSKTVLTAAHCVTSAQNIKLHFSYRRPKPEQVRTISQIIMHPDYDDETHANDIALLKFNNYVYYDPSTQPICLPTPTLTSSGKNLFPGTTTFVAGYRLDFPTNQSATPSFKVSELPVQSAEVCDPVCLDQKLVSCSPTTFCAGYLKDTNECIYGGTPLVVYHTENNRYTLEGLVTRAVSASDIWNGRCKRAESYTTFTNVTHFMPFISENLN